MAGVVFNKALSMKKAYFPVFGIYLSNFRDKSYFHFPQIKNGYKI